jgi:predicted dehydrogenase
MQKKPLKIGLIGLGKMGQNHLRVLSMLKSVELSFVYDSNGETMSRLASAYQVPAAADLDSAMTGADAVIICTPTVTHSEYIHRTAQHVRNIFVEKPLADTLDESRTVHEFARERGLNVQLGFIERFNPAVQQLKKVLDKSSQVISVDFTRTNKLSARITDVDVVTDLMIHDIDLALYLNGPVRDISAHGVREGAMIDFASALLTHENGRFSRIQASRVTEKKMRMIQATCMDMFVDCELLRKEIIINRQSEIRQVEGEPYIIAAIEEAVEVRPQEALLTELQAFVSFCHGEPGIVVPTARDGLDAMSICDQIQMAILQ